MNVMPFTIPLSDAIMAELRKNRPNAARLLEARGVKEMQVAATSFVRTLVLFPGVKAEECGEFDRVANSDLAAIFIDGHLPPLPPVPPEPPPCVSST